MVNEIKKVSFNKGECLEYLEEMVQDDLATELEEKVYLDLKWYNTYEKDEMRQVIRNMKKWYKVAF